MQNLLDKLNAQIKFIKTHKVEEESLLSATTYKHGGEITLYIGRGNSSKIMASLVEEGLEFEKSTFDCSYLKYRIDFNVGELKVSFIKTNK